MVSLSISLVLLFVSAAIMFRLNRKAAKSLRHAIQPLGSIQTLPVSVIKPVYGADHHTERNFQSWADQDYTGPLQIIFSFQDETDPAIPIAMRVATVHDLSVIVNPVEEGFSGKMSNLLHGLNFSKYEFLIFSDSDIFASPDVCSKMTAMHRSGFDLISCLMRHCRADNLWGRIYAQFWNFEHMAFIAPGIVVQGKGATGGTMAMTSKTLAQMGGLAAFKDYVAEDVAMGRKAHALGLKIGLGPVIDSPVGNMDFQALIDKFSRAALYGATMTSLCKSALYSVLLGYWAVLVLGIVFNLHWLMLAGAGWSLLRIAFASQFWQNTQGGVKIFWEVLLSDALFVAVFTKSIFSRTLVWGGIRYRVLKNGKMIRRAGR